MGSDDLYHKRKAKKARELSRKASRRKGRERVLIVCEDGKTEPNYFNDLSYSLGLTSTNIVVCGKECGSDPRSIVRYALERFQEDQGFDWVFCVFDKDSHSTYEEAIDIANRRRMPNGSKLKTIKSVPCFEYWVLLHFQRTTKPYTKIGRRSPCDNLSADLKKIFPQYSKGMNGLYDLIKDSTDTAIKNSLHAISQAQKTGTDNPSTEIHILVEKLGQISNS